MTIEIGPLIKTPAEIDIHIKIRGFSPYPTAWTRVNKDKTLKLFKSTYENTNHNLEILGNAGAYATLNVKTQSLSHGSTLELGAVDDDDYGNITQFASAAGGDYNGRMRFIAGGTEAMNLVGGRVLIGETSADTDLGGALQVVGDTYGESSILQARSAANQYGPSLDFL